ncbi:MAG: fibronectin type III domain-containing protein [Clostridia bacterium]|nr:fibronectin type III domain-containing protein [Clostridia bacterium]
MNGLKIDETNEEVHELTNLSKNTNYTIYVIAYDKAGNPKQSDSINVTTLEGGDYPTLTLNGMQQGEDLAPDALPAVAYDNNFSTYAIAVYNNVYTRYLKVDSECWGKYITLYNINNSSSLGGTIGFNKTNDKTGDYEGDWMSKLCGLTSRNKCARSVVIPEGTNWIALSSGTSNTQVSNYIYEVWCSEEDLTGKTY